MKPHLTRALDHLAKRLGYMPIRLAPEVTIEQRMGEPTWVSVQLKSVAGHPEWTRRWSGYLFPMVDGEQRGILRPTANQFLEKAGFITEDTEGE